MSALTDEEIVVAIERFQYWPAYRRREVMEMDQKERDTVGLLVALLDARPVDEDGWPERERLV